jgi:predicted kinase
MNTVYVLVGIPGSGKTTWAFQQPWFGNCAYISTDKFVEAYSHEVNKPYSAVFDFIMPTAIQLMIEDVVRARKIGKDIIWDQTSTTVMSRTRKFNMLPKYYRIAVSFPIPDQAELQHRLNQRIGKTIPQQVINSLINNYEPPTLAEGFDEIWNIT